MSALPPAARLIALALRVISRASLPILVLALLRATDPPLSSGVLARALLAMVLLPELCARLVLRAFAAELRSAGGTLSIAGSMRRIALPASSVERVEAWRLPLPSAGLALRLRSGARLGVGLAAADLAAALATLAALGIAVPAPHEPALAFTRARTARPRHWWDHALAKIGLASLVPGAIGFNAHQHIAFGHFLGEYYLMGLRAWLESAGLYWFTSALYLVLWAGCFRIAVELACWLGARVAPASAGATRRICERSATLAYYASIPTLLALRFLA